MRYGTSGCFGSGYYDEVGLLKPAFVDGGVIEESKQQLAQITHYLEQMKEDFNMDYEVVVKELPEVIVYSKRMIIPNYDYYFEIIPQIGKEVTEANPTIILHMRWGETGIWPGARHAEQRLLPEAAGAKTVAVS